MGRGYYKLHRGWQDHPVFNNEPFSRRDAWTWLIEKAVWKETRARVSGDFVTLQTGQLSYAVRYLADAWSWSKSRVARFLDELQNEAMIETRRGTQNANSQIIITICNYKKYQIIEISQEAQDGTPDEPQSGTPAGREWDASGTNKNNLNNSNLSLVPVALDSPTASPASDPVKPRVKRGAYAEHPKFADVWEALPSRGTATNSRKDAAIKFSKVVADGADPDLILQGARGYAVAMKSNGNDGTSFVQQGVTFLSKETWRQYADKLQAESGRHSPAYYDAFAAWKAGGQIGPQPRPDDFNSQGRTAA